MALLFYRLENETSQIFVIKLDVGQSKRYLEFTTTQWAKKQWSTTTITLPTSLLSRPFVIIATIPYKKKESILLHNTVLTGFLKF